jgi:hypothetical protein
MFHPIKERVLEREREGERERERERERECVLERVSMALLLSSRSSSTKRYVNLQAAKIKKIFCYQKLPFSSLILIFLLGKGKRTSQLTKRHFSSTVTKTTVLEVPASKAEAVYT